MFGIGSGELFFIAIVALIVLGPERLPKAARFVGLWVRRARAHWYSVKDELERELAAEELKRGLDNARASIREVETSVREHGATVQREFEQARDELKVEAAAVAASVAETDAAQSGSAMEAPQDDPAPQAELPLDAPRAVPTEDADAQRR